MFKRTMWATIIILSFFFTGCNQVFLEIPTQLNTQPSYDYLKDRTVLIRGKGIAEDMFGEEKEMQWTGTGVVIKQSKEYSWILTNNHVAGFSEGEEVGELHLYVVQGETLILVQDIKRSKLWDMALIKIANPLKDKRSIKGVSEVLPSDKVFLVGHHLGRLYLYGEGVFAGYDDDLGVIQVPTLFGNSGSGVFNSSGELVGLVFAVSVFSQLGDVDCSHGLIVNGPEVKKFLEKYEVL